MFSTLLLILGAVCLPAQSLNQPSRQEFLLARADGANGAASAEAQQKTAKPSVVKGVVSNSAGTISGTVMDAYGDAIPGATVIVQGETPSDRLTSPADGNGAFLFTGLKPGGYQVKISAQGFADWSSEKISLEAGKVFLVTGIQLKVLAATSSVTVYGSNEQIAVEQVQVALEQRVLGIVPNFYVVYDGKDAVPLPAKQKFRLAVRTSSDPVTIMGAAALAGFYQAARTPSYQLGAKGYGQRVGSTYLDDTTDILFGGAILPSIFHQDPRYYYQGTGSTGSRFRHAIAYPFICKGDNGHNQLNISTIGGDAISASLSNLYYPRSDRGVQLVWMNLAVGTAERMVSTLAQEFLFARFTHRAHVQ